MKFEWDENKNIKNIENHKVSFEQAVSVFYDEAAVIFQDIEHSDDVDRFIIIGKSIFEQVLFVCYCERGKDKFNEDILRIISARKATDKERRLFYE